VRTTEYPLLLLPERSCRVPEVLRPMPGSLIGLSGDQRRQPPNRHLRRPHALEQHLRFRGEMCLRWHASVMHAT